MQSAIPSCIGEGSQYDKSVFIVLWLLMIMNEKT